MKPSKLIYMGFFFIVAALLSSFRSEKSVYGNSNQKNIVLVTYNTHEVAMSRWQDTGKKGRKKTKDTVQPDVGASSYPGSAGTKPVDTTGKDSAEAKLMKTTERANIGDSAYPGSGSIDRQSRKDLKKETGKKKSIKKKKGKKAIGRKEDL